MRSLSYRCLVPVGVALILLAGIGLCIAEPGAPVARAGAPTAGLRFKDETGVALAGAIVRVLCYADDPIDPATNPLRADVMLTTDGDGQPTRSLPVGCNYIAALHLRHTQPTGKPDHGPAYWVYATSWNPAQAALKPATGDVVISRDWPLVLFNVQASLEWEPAADSRFVAELKEGLRQASAYLYDLTEGQMAFGPIAIRAGGRGWDSADLRFRAANDARPSAYVGGIVTARRPYTSSVGVSTVYAPGEIMLGRFWDGLAASNPITGTWNYANGFRTLVHEWAHYALFLYDEYRKADGSETYCTCIDLPRVGPTSVPGVCGGVPAALAASAMAYQYTASELWLPTLPPPSVCLGTDQYQVHGEPDWATLRDWGDLQGLAPEPLRMPATLTPDSDFSLAQTLFDRWPGYRVYLPVLLGSGPGNPPVTEPGLNLSVGGDYTLAELNALYPQVYLARAATGSSPAAIIYQGTGIGPRSAPRGLGYITLFDVHPTDRVWATAERYSAGGTAGIRLRGSVDPPVASGQTLQFVGDTWQASLDLAYGMAGPLLTTMTVTLTSPQALFLTPTAQLCAPASTLGCPAGSAWRRTMQRSGDTLWTATLQAPAGSELPHYGVLQVRATGVGELLRWYLAAGGVGPAHIEGDAPLRDGPAVVDAVTTVSGQRNRVIIMPAANHSAITAPLPSHIRGIVGVPLDIDVLLPDSSTAVSAENDGVAAQSHFLPAPVRFTLFYRQDVIDRLGIQEHQLRVLHFTEWQGGVWFEVPLAGASHELDWLTTAPQKEDGIYAVGWTAYIPTPTATPTQALTYTPTSGPRLSAVTLVQGLTPTPTATLAPSGATVVITEASDQKRNSLRSPWITVSNSKATSPPQVMN